MKRIRFFLLAVVLLLSIPVAADAASPSTGASIEISTVAANAGDTVNVSIVLENNPGIASLRLQLSYNKDVLTLKSVTYGGLFSDNMISNVPEDLAAAPYTLLWYHQNGGTANCTENGVLATLCFEIDPFAETDSYELSLSCSKNDVLDARLKPVSIETVPGAVELLPHWDKQHQTFRMNLPKNMTVLAAGYQNGQMMYCRFLRSASDEEGVSPVSFTPPGTPTDEVRLFLLNEDYQPVHDVLCISRMK